MRSSSGPLRRRRWRARSAGRAAAARRPPMPHGHGFVAATSMKRVGKHQTLLAADDHTWPSSSGWRSASRLGRGNSESSSRNSTPWWASVASPGAGARRRRPGRTAEIVWCGARNGRARDEPAAGVQPGDAGCASPRSPPRRQRRQDRRQAPREHRLARAGRPVHEEVVAAGGGDLERRDQRVAGRGRRRGRASASRSGVAGGAGERRRGSRRRRARRPPRASDSTPSTSTPATSAASRARARGSTSRATARGGRAPSATASAPRIARSSPASDSSPTIAQRSTRLGGRAGRRRRASRPRAEGRSPGPTLRRYAGARLTVIRRCGNSKPEFDDRRPHPLARLAHRLVGEPHDRERRQPGADVGLDPHPPRSTPVEREGDHARERSGR